MGTALLTSTLVLRDGVQVNLDQAFNDAYTGVDAAVEGRRTIGSPVTAESQPLDPAVATTLRGLPEVRAVAPQIEGPTEIVGRDGNALGLPGAPARGASWVEVEDLRTWRLVEGGAPRAAGEVVIDAASAARGGLGVGDRATVLVPERLDVRVVGLVEFAGGPVPGDATVTFFSRSDAARHLGADPDAVTSILIDAVPGTSSERLIGALESTAPADAVVLDNPALVDRAVGSIGDTSVEVLADLLLAFAAVAVVVAVVGMHNTFTIMVAQRAREIGLLRAVGATRRQVLSSVIVEGAALGLVASAGGVLLGLGLTVIARPALGLAGLGVYAGAVRIEPATVLIAMSVGVAGTLIGAVAPAVRAARVSPVQAFVEAQLDEQPRKIRTVAGAGVLLAGVALTVLAGVDIGDPFAAVGLGAVGIVAGVVALGPAAIRPASSLLTAPFVRRPGFTGQLARDNAQRNPRRTAASASAVLIGLTLVAALAVIENSVRVSIERTVTDSFAGDLVILASSFSGVGLSPELDNALESTADVDMAVAVGLGAGQLDGEDRVFTVADPDRLDEVLALDVRAGALDAVGDDGIAVSTALADEAGWTVGSDVRVERVNGVSVDLSVAAIYQGRIGDALGTAVVPEHAWLKHAGPPALTAIFIDLADGAATASGEATVERVTEQFGNPTVLDENAYVDRQLGSIRQLLTILYALLGLSVAIAAMGISNTLSLSVYERRRELGILRAVGQTRPQMRAMIRIEATIVALLGTLAGLCVGTFIGWGLLTALAGETGVDALVVPYGVFGLIALAVSAIGLVASEQPARRAAAVPPVVAMTTD